MRNTLADIMRTQAEQDKADALKMEEASSIELQPVETFADVVIPEGLEVRVRPHVVILPSPASADSVVVDLQQEDQFVEIAPESISITTVAGTEETVATAVTIDDPALAGRVRVRYMPAEMAMEDAEKPFVQLGNVTQPGEEQKNPFPPNSPTEPGAPPITNDSTVMDDKAELEEKNGVQAVDQSSVEPVPAGSVVPPQEGVADEVDNNATSDEVAQAAVDDAAAEQASEQEAENMTAAENVEAGEEQPGDDDVQELDNSTSDPDVKVDPADGNTGEEKAEEVAEESEEQGPAEEAPAEGDVGDGSNDLGENVEDADAASAEQQEDTVEDVNAETDSSDDGAVEDENTDAETDGETDQEEEDGDDEFDDINFESFSQPIEVITAQGSVEPVVFPAERQFHPETVKLVQEQDGEEVVIPNENLVVRVNEAGLGEAIVITDPELRGELRAEYQALKEGGEIPASLAIQTEDPVVTITEVDSEEDGVTLRMAMVADADEPLPLRLIEIQEEGVVVLEEYKGVLPAISSVVNACDAFKTLRFEGDQQSAELVMEGLMDSVKTTMNKLGNFFDHAWHYKRTWDEEWRKEMASLQKEIATKKSGEKKADIVDIGRIVRRLTIDGSPCVAPKDLQKALASFTKLGADGVTFTNAIGDMYSDMTNLVIQNGSTNPDGEAVLKGMPAIVKKVPMRIWESGIHGKGKVNERSQMQYPVSSTYLGELKYAEMQSLNELTYANPDPDLAKLLKTTYVAIRADWDLEDNLISAEMPVMTMAEIEAVAKALRAATEQWSMSAVFDRVVKDVRKWYDVVYSVKSYDRDFIAAYGAAIAAEQWMVQPTVLLYNDVSFPFQGILRLLRKHLACYK